MSVDPEATQSNPGTQSTKSNDYNWNAPTPKLNAAFARARVEFPAIPKNRTSKVMKDGRLLYEFHYADLADILAATTPALSKHGLYVDDLVVEIDDSRLRLWTLLVHESGEMKRSIVPLPPNTDPQKWGGFLTYMRRYMTGAILGVASEEDDDGNRAAGNEHSTGQRERKTQGKGEAKAPVPSTGGKQSSVTKPGDPATANDIKALFAQAKENKWTEKLLKDVMEQLYKKDSTKKLTHQEIYDLRVLVKGYGPEAFSKAFAEGRIVQDPDGRWSD